MDSEIVNNTRNSPSIKQKLAKVRLLITRTNPRKNRGNHLNIINHLAKTNNIHSHGNDVLPASPNKSEEMQPTEILRQTTITKPIMGKNALIAKMNAANKLAVEDNCDMYIIQQIIEDSFGATLRYLQQKSLKRRQARAIRNAMFLKNDEVENPALELDKFCEKTADVSAVYSEDGQKSTTDSKLEFDSEDFLKNALGDDLFVTCNSSQFSQNLVSTETLFVVYNTDKLNT